MMCVMPTSDVMFSREAGPTTPVQTDRCGVHMEAQRSDPSRRNHLRPFAFIC